MKKNFRCTDDEAWDAGLAKAENMRRAGFDIDMTMILNREVKQFATETTQETAERLGLAAGGEPVGLYRVPTARVAE